MKQKQLAPSIYRATLSSFSRHPLPHETRSRGRPLVGAKSRAVGLSVVEAMTITTQLLDSRFISLTSTLRVANELLHGRKLRVL